MDPAKLVFFIIMAVLVGMGMTLVKDLRKYLLMVTVAFAPMSSGLIFYHFNGLMLMDFPLLALLVMSVLFPERRFHWGFPGMRLAIALFLGWTFVTCFTAANTGWAFSEFTRLLRGYLLFVVVANYANSPERVRSVFFAVLGTFAFQAVLGTYQWRYGPLGLRVLEEVGFEWRAAGTFEHPGVFGDYLILVLPVFVRLFAFHRNTDKRYTWAYLALLVFGMGGLLGSYARGPWLSFAGAMLLMFLYSIPQRRLRPRAKLPLMVIGLAAIAFAIQYSDVILHQFISEDRQSSSEIRKPLNRVALRMALDHPVLGVGLGCYRLMSLPYARLEYNPEMEFPLYQLSQIAHNSYLLISSEAGFPAAAFFLFFIFSALRMGRRVLRLKNPFLSNLSLGLMTGLLGFIVSINTGPNLMNHQLIMMYWMFAGWLTAMSRFRVPAPSPRRSATGPAVDAGTIPGPNGNETIDFRNPH